MKLAPITILIDDHLEPRLSVGKVFCQCNFGCTGHTAAIDKLDRDAHTDTEGGIIRGVCLKLQLFLSLDFPYFEEKNVRSVFGD